jgi:hypothetical protein
MTIRQIRGTGIIGKGRGDREKRKDVKVVEFFYYKREDRVKDRKWLKKG